jgi:hypothetical protein
MQEPRRGRSLFFLVHRAWSARGILFGATLAWSEPLGSMRVSELAAEEDALARLTGENPEMPATIHNARVRTAPLPRYREERSASWLIV